MRHQIKNTHEVEFKIISIVKPQPWTGVMSRMWCTSLPQGAGIGPQLGIWSWMEVRIEGWVEGWPWILVLRCFCGEFVDMKFFFRFMEMYKYKCSHLSEKFYHLWDCVTHPCWFASHSSFQYGTPVPAVPLSFSCSVSSSCGNFLTKSQRFMLHSSWKAATLTLEAMIVVEKHTMMGRALE